MAPCYHYAFTDECKNQVAIFAKEHQNRSCKEYKQEWDEWIKTKQSMIDQEMRIMKQQGFLDDRDLLISKLYVSGRYYHRKKKSEDKSPKERKQYKKKDTQLMEQIELFLKQTNEDVDKPSSKYYKFIKLHVLEDSKELKKLFKNKYYRWADGDDIPKTNKTQSNKETPKKTQKENMLANESENGRECVTYVIRFLRKRHLTGSRDTRALQTK